MSSLNPDIEHDFVDRYLERINYTGSREPSLGVLQELQRSHMLSVPFENFSNVYREKVVLTREWLFDKVIRRRRGGICHELNPLFAMLLEDLGFQVTLLGAGAFSQDAGTFEPLLGHAVVLIDLDGDRWLVDVGYGDCYETPLKLVEDEIQQRGFGIHRIRKDGPLYRYEKRDIVVTDSGTECHARNKDQDKWLPLYIFDLQPRKLQDFETWRHFYQMDPDSFFNQGRICTVLKPYGRMTLSRNQLITTKIDCVTGNASKEVRVLQQPEDDVTSILEREFGITLDGVGVNTLPPIASRD